MPTEQAECCASYEFHQPARVESGDRCCIHTQVTDPYLNLFRGLVPPLLGTIDFSDPPPPPPPHSLTARPRSLSPAALPFLAAGVLQSVRCAFGCTGEA